MDLQPLALLVELAGHEADVDALDHLASKEGEPAESASLRGDALV
jgi:hypothetical protein